MLLELEISQAIRSHERWKIKLSASIKSGTVIADAFDVGRVDICDFGRWLNGATIPKDAQYDPHYSSVQLLHAKFHKCAEKVVYLLSEGKKTDAGALMASDGEYTKTSDQLIATMVDWKKSVHKPERKRNPFLMTIPPSLLIAADEAIE
jgi:hypothetical protein